MPSAGSSKSVAIDELLKLDFQVVINDGLIDNVLYIIEIGTLYDLWNAVNYFDLEGSSDIGSARRPLR